MHLFVVAALLGALTRPEFAGTALALFALVAWRRPDLRWQLVKSVALLFVLPGLAVTGWRYATYGDVVPNTFYVKQRLPGLWGLGYVRRFLLILAVPYLLMAAPSLRRLWREQRELLYVVIVAVGVPCVYFTSVRPLRGWWYRFLIPQLPILAWLAAVAVSTAPVGAGRRLGLWLRPVGVALMCVFALAHVPTAIDFVPMRHNDDERLGEVGRRLRPWAAADRSLSYYDIGRLPYEAGWTVVDVVGLTTSRHDLQGDCRNNTDLLLRSVSSEPAEPVQDIENPCPKVYETLVDLDFLDIRPTLSRRMRVFVKRDLPYAGPLRQALIDGWPAPYHHQRGWAAQFMKPYDAWFGQ
jgi:hypothetical protein